MPIRKIKHHARRYDSKWKNHDGSLKSVIKSCFFVELPHIIPTLTLIYFFPEKWLGILILGVLLPDFSFDFNNLFNKKVNWTKIIGTGSKSHYILFAVVILLLFSREYIIAFSGIIHLLLDLLGF